MNSGREIDNRGFKCGEFEVEPTRSLLIFNGKSFSLEPRIMDVFCVLAEKQGDVLSRDDLIDRIWNVEFGADESLTRAISILRKTFRTAGSTKTYIETFPKRGYRLSQPVAICDIETAIPETLQALPSHIKKEPEASKSSTPMKVLPEIAIQDGVTKTQDYRTRSDNRNLGKNSTIAIILIAILFFGIFGSLQFGNRSSSRPDVLTVNARSIAVLPFADYSPSKDQAYFADGIAEELLNVLARIEGLRVASRTSSFAYDIENLNIGKIGRELEVRHVLEGSIRKSGGTVRISAQLIDTETDEHIWSRTYERKLSAENIFAVQDDISRSIASELKVQMVINDNNLPLPTKSTEAYEAYLKGKALYEPRTRTAIQDSIDELNRAVALDPNFAAAHATLARVYMMAQEYSTMEPNVAYSRASIHLQKALKLAPNSSESLTAKAQILYQQRNYSLALEYFNIATVADPLDSEAWRGKGLSLKEIGRIDEAMSAFQKALDINPLSSIIQLNIGNLQIYQNDLVTAKRSIETALILDRDNVAAHEQLSLMTMLSGRYVEAHTLYQESSERFPRVGDHLQRLYYLIGRPDLELRDMDWYNQSYAAFNAGDAEKATRMASDPHNNGSSSQIVEILYYAGHLDKAYEKVKNDHVQLDTFTSQAPINSYNEQSAMLYYKILVAKKDPFSVVLYDKLFERFETKSPDDFHFVSSLSAGASWQILNERPNESLSWLDAMNERGQLWRYLEFDPLFDRLAEMPAFQERWEKMEDNAAKYGEAIDRQLAVLSEQ